LDDLTDVNAPSPNDGDALTWDDDTSKWIPVSVSGGSGASDFLSLDDTPSSYSGEGEKFVKVNAAEDALEFVTGGAGASTFLDLTDTPDDYTDQEFNYVVVSGAENELVFMPQNRQPLFYGDIPPAEPYRTYMAENGSSEFEIYGDLDGWELINGAGSNPTHTTLSGWLNSYPTDDYYDVHNSLPSRLIMYGYGIGEKMLIKKQFTVASGTISAIAAKVGMFNSNNTGDKVNFFIARDEPSGSWGSGPPNGSYANSFEIQRNGDNLFLRHYRKNGAGEINVDTTQFIPCQEIFLAFTTQSDDSIKAWWSMDGVIWSRVTQDTSTDVLCGAINWVGIGLYDGSLAHPPTMCVVDWIRMIKNENNLWRLAGNWKNDW